MPFGQYEIRSPIDVARRALALQAFLMRIQIEHSWGWGDEEISESDADVMRDRLLTWLEEESIIGYASDAELEVIEAEIGELADWQIKEGSYRLESLAVLTWALEKIEDIPEFDEGVQEEEIFTELPNVESSIEDFIDYSHLRAEEELVRERKTCELWTKRARAFESAGEQASPPSAETKKLATAAIGLGAFSKLIDDDFPTYGKPYYKLDRDEFEHLRAITNERQKAFNWLFGMGDDWDRTPIDVVIEG